MERSLTAARSVPDGVRADERKLLRCRPANLALVKAGRLLLLLFSFSRLRFRVVSNAVSWRKPFAQARAGIVNLDIDLNHDIMGRLRR
jgi:hypothetical protein